MGSTGHVGDGAKATHGEKFCHANASAELSRWRDAQRITAAIGGANQGS
jgi:hypothetical protein